MSTCSKAACLICGSRRKRNLIQVDVMGWFFPGRRTKGFACIRCLAGRKTPQIMHRYATTDQKKAAVRFKRTQKETYELYKVGSDEWFCIDVEELDNKELIE